MEEDTFIALENDELLPVSNKVTGCQSNLKAEKSEKNTCELSATENVGRIKEKKVSICVQDLKEIAPGMVLPPLGDKRNNVLIYLTRSPSWNLN
jgi:hypothetical protein